jgi:hypothetical protein
VPPELIFGVDETMLESISNSMEIIPYDYEDALSTSEDNFPHISAMLMHFILGDALHSFILFSNIQNFPSELEEFDNIFCNIARVTVSC